MKTLALLFSLFIFSPQLFAHTCPHGMVHLDTAHVCMGFEFTEGPYINNRGERRLSKGIVTLKSHEYDLDLSGATFFIWMKMPNMQHGGRPLSLTYLGEGRFEVENMLLVRMPGQWFLRVLLEPGDATIDPSIDYDGELALTKIM
jgi:hypothetical protein